jgi:hypothetical protein
VQRRTPFATGWADRIQQSRGSKRRLTSLRRQVTRREILLAVLGAIALLLFGLFSLVAKLRHREEHRQRRLQKSP